MRIIISPAKKLNEEQSDLNFDHSIPQFLSQSQSLIDVLQEKDSYEVASLMKLSMNLADLNVSRFQQWHTPFTTRNAKQALLSFAGDVYQGLDAYSLTQEDMLFAQEHLRILSGLYGLLRPLDLIQPYRLEMGTRLTTPKGGNLYEFWGDALTEQLNTELEESDVLINLASVEYFKSIQAKNIHCPIITPEFKENKNGTYKVIGIFAKKARGLMTRYIIQNRITNVESIKGFNVGGYIWNPSLSDDKNWVFTRD